MYLFPVDGVSLVKFLEDFTIKIKRRKGCKDLLMLEFLLFADDRLQLDIGTKGLLSLLLSP